MIVNIRGTHGSGKSALVREVMARAQSKVSIYGATFGLRRPEAYKLDLPEVTGSAFVVGPYRTACGGLDCIQPYDHIPGLTEKYAARGHVLMEGIIVAKTYGRVGRLLESYGQQATVAFLDTSLEDCVAGVEARRAERGDGRKFDPTNLTAGWNACRKLRDQFRAAGRVRVIDISRDNGADQIIELLRQT